MLQISTRTFNSNIMEKKFDVFTCSLYWTLLFFIIDLFILNISVLVNRYLQKLWRTRVWPHNFANAFCFEMCTSIEDKQQAVRSVYRIFSLQDSWSFWGVFFGGGWVGWGVVNLYFMFNVSHMFNGNMYMYLQ